MIKIVLFLSLASLTGLHTPAIIIGEKLDRQGNEVVTEIVESNVQEVSIGIEAEDVVKSYFKDTPLLVKVAQCESNFRHVDKNGEVLRGIANRYDVGIMQINERFHLDKANRLGIDIYSLNGNLEYAKYLYEKEGVIPWRASSKCWTRISQQS
jgi:hypothetical protein